MGVLALLCFSRPVQAELYVAGQIGAHMPNDASNVMVNVSGTQVGGSDLALQNSLMYGGKLGYYFDQVKLGKFNLGIETEMFIATPHIKSQAVTIGSITGTQPGLLNRVLTWAPVVVLVRYQAGAFEPYAGVGLGLFFSNLIAKNNLSANDISDTRTHVGLNTQVGIRYRVNQNLSLFTEWKYNHANIEHHGIGGIPFSMSYDYNVHIVAGGIGYHF
jgi:opacity protein-like surface antigen